MDNYDNAKNAKNADFFLCECCDFKCCKKSNYLCHINTKKHNDNKMVTNDNDFMPKNAKYLCNCGNIYKYMSGLSRHKKKCKNIIEIDNIEKPSKLITTELVLELIKDNKDMKQIILEQNNTINNLVKNGTNQFTNSLNNNNNKTFNLQVFLNETCKDAMNITDFIDSIKLELSDLIKVGELGYVEGISNIITTNLKALDITKRPLHCTDKKRETIYIKDENKWEKDENNIKLKNIINKVSNKNIKLIKMIIEAMGGLGDNTSDKEDKIIRNISKCTTIEKYSDI
jgi:hypothetical protein